jgi:hypothetical protein
MRSDESTRLFFMVSPNLDEPEWQRENKFHHPEGNLLLPANA